MSRGWLQLVGVTFVVVPFLYQLRIENAAFLTIVNDSDAALPSPVPFDGLLPTIQIIGASLVLVSFLIRKRHPTSQQRSTLPDGLDTSGQPSDV